MPLFGGKKKDDGGGKAAASGGKKKAGGGGKRSSGAGKKQAPAAPAPPPVQNKAEFVGDMIADWEDTDERLAQLPVEDWEFMKEEILEVTDRLYDIQKYPGDYKVDFIQNFKNEDFLPMMTGAKEIVKETTYRVLFEVDNRADALDEWLYCEEFIKRRGKAIKGLDKLQKEIDDGKAAAALLQKEGLLMSNDEIFDQFDILERVLVKVRPKVDKVDLKDYVTLRNMDERFIQGANKPIKKLQAMEFKEWMHIKDDVDVLQELMIRMRTKFDTKEEADDHIKKMKKATKVVKKHIFEIEQEAAEQEQEEDTKGKKKKKKAAPAKKKGAAEKKAAPAKKKGTAEKKKKEPEKPEKKGGWLSRKMGK